MHTTRTIPTARHGRLRSKTRCAGRGTRRGAFTIVELMIVVAIVAVLISILLVAFRGARSSAQQALAQRLLTTVGQAVESFERDLSYLPPLLVYDQPQGMQTLLGNQPSINETNPSLTVPEAKYNNPGNAASLRTELEATRYGSEFTLACYLLGTGDIDNSEAPSQAVGRNDDNDDGKAGAGFRDPGPDRSWGGGANREFQRTNLTAAKVGRAYGPYLDPAGLQDHLRLDGRTGMFKLTDTWNQPLRFYKGWPTKDRLEPGTPPRDGVDFTPVELRTAEGVEYQANDTTNQRPNLELERPIFSARFMVLSAGRPIFEGRDGPIPLFGDRNRGGAPQMSAIDDLPSIQDLSLPFAPGVLNFDPRGGGSGDLLLEDLKSNLRYLP